MTGQLIEQDARPSGASVKERVVGAGAPSQSDPFLAPFFETATEHVWGALWNRPGLGLVRRCSRSAATRDFRRPTRRSTY